MNNQLNAIIEVARNVENVDINGDNIIVQNMDHNTNVAARARNPAVRAARSIRMNPGNVANDNNDVDRVVQGAETEQQQPPVFLTENHPASLTLTTMDLERSKTFPYGPSTIAIKAIERLAVVHDDVLFLPHWQELALAMDSQDVKYVKIANFELPRVVLDTLGPALDKHRIKKLELWNANLDDDGFFFLEEFLQRQPMMEVLNLSENRTMSNVRVEAMKSFATSLKRHPSIKEVWLNHCRLGENMEILSLILDALRFKTITLHLSSNGLKSSGASLVATFLESNPAIKALHLNDNNFSDDDVALFLPALRDNTNLKDLWLRSNKFSGEGERLLVQEIYNDVSLNAIFDSNHFCGIHWDILSKEGAPRLRVSNGNCPKLNRRHKINYALGISDEKGINVNYLLDVPLLLMPEVIPMFQTISKSRYEQRRCLTNMFNLVRNWKLPALFACAGGGFKQNEHQ